MLRRVFEFWFFEVVDACSRELRFRFREMEIDGVMWNSEVEWRFLNG